MYVSLLFLGAYRNNFLDNQISRVDNLIIKYMVSVSTFVPLTSFKNQSGIFMCIIHTYKLHVCTHTYTHACTHTQFLEAFLSIAMQKPCKFQDSSSTIQFWLIIYMKLIYIYEYRTDFNTQHSKHVWTILMITEQFIYLSRAGND